MNGRILLLEGIIDRVDRFDSGELSYMRVIDYKSSQHELKPERLWLGTQLQLLLYLKAVSEGVPGTPAGAFYFHIKDPSVTVKQLMTDPQQLLAQAQASIADSMKLKGLVLADVDVIEAMKAGRPDG